MSFDSVLYTVGSLDPVGWSHQWSIAHVQEPEPTALKAHINPQDLNAKSGPTSI
ncbi:MAG TPA: hypothetical protein PLH57_03405 [Oligoflexia bacterium]|nr:hypothetical protein [Oligoflexia bacterium]